MSLEVNGQVGPQNLSDGATQTLRIGRQAEVIVQELHGRYYETAFRRAMYSGGNAAGVATTVGAATTYTGLCLSNPIGSPVNLVVNKIAAAFGVAPTAAAIVGIMTGFSAATNVVQTTPVPVVGKFVGAPAGDGLLASAATLPVAPTFAFPIGFLTATAVTVVDEPDVLLDLEGSLILPPGGFAAFFTSTAGAAAGAAFGFQWEEVPLGG